MMLFLTCRRIMLSLTRMTEHGEMLSWQTSLLCLLSGTPNSHFNNNHHLLCVLRYQHREDSYLHPYKIIRLTSRFIKFRVIKVLITTAHVLAQFLSEWVHEWASEHMLRESSRNESDSSLFFLSLGTCFRLCNTIWEPLWAHHSLLEETWLADRWYTSVLRRAPFSHKLQFSDWYP